MDQLAAGLTPLAGGHSGETFLAEVAGEQSVVRIYGPGSAWRGPLAAEVDAAVLRLVRGLLPVPEVLEVRTADPSSGAPAVLVTSRLPGERLELVLPDAAEDLRRTVGTRLGEVLAMLGQMPFLRAGFFVDGDLTLGPTPDAAHDLVEWVERHLSGALAAWSSEDQSSLLAVADRAQGRLDTVDRHCLVHSDFNPKNMLVDPRTGTITGLLDWEYAHAGSPYADLGNLLRFDREPAFISSVLAAYVGSAPPAPVDLVDLARSADLWALVDLAARRDRNPVARRAHDRLLTIARTGDVHAEE